MKCVFGWKPVVIGWKPDRYTERTNGSVPRRKPSQKLATGAFGIKLNSLSLGLAKSIFYDILQ